MNTGSFWKTTLTYALAGPPIGGLVLVGWWTAISAARSGAVDGAVFWLALAGIFYGYVFGLLPAFLTGALSSAASPLIRPWWAWAAISGLIGWLISALALGWGGLLTDEPIGKLLNGLIGAIPALNCAWLSRKYRPSNSGRLTRMAET